MDARRCAVRRWAALIAITIASVPTAAGASAGAPAAPGQQEPEPDDRDLAASTLVDIDTLVATDASALATKLEDFATDIENQLDTYHTAQKAIADAESALADADNALNNTQLLIEETTAASDEVVVDAFMSPPNENALEVLATESLTEATVRQMLLDREADSSAATLSDLEEALAKYEELEATQQEALDKAETARANAKAAFADLESSLSAQAQFITAVEAEVTDQTGEAPNDPELQARAGEINTMLAAAAERRAAAEAARRAEEERQRKIREGIMFCPVDGAVSFIDSWGFARSGGRTHKGVDMMASHGTPTVAPVSGRVEHRGSSLGGLSWYLYGDNGNTYYGTHLQGYENVGAGHVEGGTVIGYVGSSGNASASGPHLHFEIHPGGGYPVNPYPATAEACPDH